MVPAVAAKIIVLESHPVWTAAQWRACERREAMRRHPSFMAQREVAGSVVGTAGQPNVRPALRLLR